MLEPTSNPVATSAPCGSTTLIWAANVVYLRSLRRLQLTILTNYVRWPNFSSVLVRKRDTKATGWAPLP